MKLGGKWYWQTARKKEDNDWYGDLDGIRFRVCLEEKKGTCVIYSEKPVPEIGKVMLKILKYKVGMFCLSTNPTEWKQKILLARDGNQLSILLEKLGSKVIPGERFTTK